MASFLCPLSRAQFIFLRREDRTAAFCLFVRRHNDHNNAICSKAFPFQGGQQRQGFHAGKRVMSMGYTRTSTALAQECNEMRGDDPAADSVGIPLSWVLFGLPCSAGLCRQGVHPVQFAIC